MDLTVNLFTSFGYFERDEEHAAALREMAATVRPGGGSCSTSSMRQRCATAGWAALAPHGSRHDRERRRPLRMQIVKLADGQRLEERVRLFAPGELEALLRAGVTVVHQFGDYDGGPLRPGRPGPS